MIGIKKFIQLIIWIILTLQISSSEATQSLEAQLSDSLSWEVSLPAAYKSFQSNQAIFLDIRSKESFVKGHVPNSININLPDLPQTLLEKPGMLPKGQPIYVVCCAQDRNALWAVLPLRMAGYEAYNVTGGGVDAWEYLKLPIAKGASAPLESRWKTELSTEEKEYLLSINPSYHMMKAGRSYVYDRKGIEKLLEEGKEAFVVEIVKNTEDKATSKYTKQGSTLSELPNAPWLKGFSKDQTIFLIGENDKEVVLGVVALRMMGYDALMMVEK